jgi:CheY-like chemotaxis protein
VIILSGLERPPAEPDGHVGWIAKPVDPKALHGILEQVIHRGAGPARVLVVENDADVARVMSETFRPLGIETHCANSGESAISLSQAADPDLLLLDLAQSDGDGLRVVDWYRQAGRLRRVPVMVYSGREAGELTKDVVSLLERVVPANGVQHT